jgi:hypothetical protein
LKNDTELFNPQEGTDQFFWLSPSEASKLIHDCRQKKLLKNCLPGKAPARQRFWANWITPLKYRRLAGVIQTFKTELEFRYKEDEIKSQKWYQLAAQSLAEAEINLNRGDIDNGWKSFNAAMRAEIYILNKDQLRIRAEILKYESEKLFSWRKKSIESLLENFEPERTDASEKVFQAALIRDEYFNNQVYKAGLIKNHMFILFWAAVIDIFLIFMNWFIYSYSGIKNLHLVIFCILFGMLGSIFSSALKLKGASMSSRIPEFINDFKITFLRIIIGGLSAILFYLIFYSSFFSLIFNLGNHTNHYTLLVLAFLSGFSERLVLKAAEAVTNEKS